MKATVTTPSLTKDQVVKLLERNWNHRQYVVGSIKDFAFRLDTESAFAFSRMLPKEVMEKLAENTFFSDKIIDCYLQVKEGGPVEEVIKTTQLEEKFLSSRLAEMLKYVGKVEIDGVMMVT